MRVDQIERRRVFPIDGAFVLAENSNGVIAGCRNNQSGCRTPGDAVNRPVVRAGNGTNALPRLGISRTDDDVLFGSAVTTGASVFVVIESAPDFQEFVVADAD